MDIGSATSAVTSNQLSQQLQSDLQAIAQTQQAQLAVADALLGGGQPVSANPNLGQIVNLSV
jgi:hypothetical protein